MIYHQKISFNFSDLMLHLLFIHWLKSIVTFGFSLSVLVCCLLLSRLRTVAFLKDCLLKQLPAKAKNDAMRAVRVD